MRHLLALLVVSLAVAAGNAAHAATHAAVCRSGYYENVSRNCVKRPARAPSAPAGATATCRDGTYSFSQHASGTCSHHGGVAAWIHHP